MSVLELPEQCKVTAFPARSSKLFCVDKPSNLNIYRGYMAPEYALWGYLTNKVDVYSFGVVLLETVSGKNNNNYMPSNNSICLLDWVWIWSMFACCFSLMKAQLECFNDNIKIFQFFLHFSLFYQRYWLYLKSNIVTGLSLATKWEYGWAHRSEIGVWY